VRTSQLYSDQANAIAIASVVLDLPLGCAKLFFFCYKFIFQRPMAALKRKAVVKIGMQATLETYD